MTYTLAVLRVAPETFDDIKRRVDALVKNVDPSYSDMFLEERGEPLRINLTHIAIEAEPRG